MMEWPQCSGPDGVASMEWSWWSGLSGVALVEWSRWSGLGGVAPVEWPRWSGPSGVVLVEWSQWTDNVTVSDFSWRVSKINKKWFLFLFHFLKLCVSPSTSPGSFGCHCHCLGQGVLAVAPLLGLWGFEVPTLITRTWSPSPREFLLDHHLLMFLPKAGAPVSALQAVVPGQGLCPLSHLGRGCWPLGPSGSLH